MHKTGIAIRQLINNRTAPAYKLAKNITKILNQHISLNDHNNITNSVELANELTKLEVEENHRSTTFDVRELYVNVPIYETLNITKNKSLQKVKSQMPQQIMSLLRVVLTQKHFTFQQTIYQPNQGIAMGFPISSLIAEIFLQKYGDKNTSHLIDTKNIAYYARYVNDILIIFDTTKISLHYITRYINSIHSNINLNTIYEQQISIDFLELTITRQHKKLEKHIQKAKCHGHNNQLPFKPPHRTKNGSL